MPSFPRARRSSSPLQAPAAHPTRAACSSGSDRHLLVLVAAAALTLVLATGGQAAADSHQGPIGGGATVPVPTPEGEGSTLLPGVEPDEDAPAAPPESSPEQPAPDGEPPPSEDPPPPPGEEPAPGEPPPGEAGPPPPEAAPPEAGVQSSGEVPPAPVAAPRPSAGSAGAPRLQQGYATGLGGLGMGEGEAPGVLPPMIAAPGVAVAPPEGAPSQVLAAPGRISTGFPRRGTVEGGEGAVPDGAVLVLLAGGLAWFERRYRARYRVGSPEGS
ncbi:MAG TPA: hypothetical protein VM324_14215 [Egibacteraceae bacterium]|nr:hypothetical protein [Egibacteraceae bacterium]